MIKSRFTKGETIALCALPVALLVATCTMMPGGNSGGDSAAIAAADSAYRAKADSLALLLGQLADSGRVDTVRNGKERKAGRQKADSAAHGRKGRRKASQPYVPATRNYLDETLSSTEAR